MEQVLPVVGRTHQNGQFAGNGLLTPPRLMPNINDTIRRYSLWCHKIDASSVLVLLIAGW